MSIDPLVLEILVCPACHGGLVLIADGGALLCSSCRRRYPVVDDIPNMLIDEATIEPEGRRGD